MTQENVTRNALQKLETGDGLNDEELNMLLAFYANAEDVLIALVSANKGYKFSLNEVRHRYETLKVFKRYREKKQ